MQVHGCRPNRRSREQPDRSVGPGAEQPRLLGVKAHVHDAKAVLILAVEAFEVLVMMRVIG
mgnify:CR=1 FL=1